MFEDSNKPTQYKPRQILPDSLLSYQGVVNVSFRRSLFLIKYQINTKYLIVFRQPRSLKQSCRVVIYNTINQRPATTVAKLPLPPVLKDYLLNFEQ